MDLPQASAGLLRFFTVGRAMLRSAMLSLLSPGAVNFDGAVRREDACFSGQYLPRQVLLVALIKQ